MEYWCAAPDCMQQMRGYGQDSLFEIPKNKNRIPEFSC